MKYRLKDQELQKKLDEISGGSFTEYLESDKKPSCIVFLARNNGPAMSVFLTRTAIEPFAQYGPDDWNPYPEVTPPEGILMRVEQVQFKTHEKAKGITIRKCAIFRKGEWVDDVVGYPLASIENCRFRPWE